MQIVAHPHTDSQGKPVKNVLDFPAETSKNLLKPHIDEGFSHSKNKYQLKNVATQLLLGERQNVRLSQVEAHQIGKETKEIIKQQVEERYQQALDENKRKNKYLSKDEKRDLYRQIRIKVRKEIKENRAEERKAERKIQKKKAKSDICDYIVPLTTAKFRVCNCGQTRIDSTKPIGLRYNDTLKKSSFDNIQRCGSVWTCPTCSAKIAEFKRNEIDTAISRWIGKEEGWEVRRGSACVLMTMTFSHDRNELLEDVFGRMRNATKMFWGHRRIKEVKTKYGISHTIRALEITYGKNGWHPHYHIVLFLENLLKEDELAELEKILQEEWSNACLKKNSYANEHGIKLSSQVGLRKAWKEVWLEVDEERPEPHLCPPSPFLPKDEIDVFAYRHSCPPSPFLPKDEIDVRPKRMVKENVEVWEEVGNSTTVSGYMAKDQDREGQSGSKPDWTWGSEISKSHIKKGKGSVTPWDMLRLTTGYNDLWAKRFREYAHAVKGKRQHVWSKMLRWCLDVESNMTDEMIANAVDLQSETVAEFNEEDWRKIKTQHRQAEVLSLCTQDMANMQKITHTTPEIIGFENNPVPEVYSDDEWQEIARRMKKYKFSKSTPLEKPIVLHTNYLGSLMDQINSADDMYIRIYGKKAVNLIQEITDLEKTESHDFWSAVGQMMGVGKLDFAKKEDRLEVRNFLIDRFLADEALARDISQAEPNQSDRLVQQLIQAIKFNFIRFMPVFIKDSMHLVRILGLNHVGSRDYYKEYRDKEESLPPFLKLESNCNVSAMKAHCTYKDMLNEA